MHVHVKTRSLKCKQMNSAILTGYVNKNKLSLIILKLILLDIEYQQVHFYLFHAFYIFPTSSIGVGNSLTECYVCKTSCRTAGRKAVSIICDFAELSSTKKTVEPKIIKIWLYPVQTTLLAIIAISLFSWLTWKRYQHHAITLILRVRANFLQNLILCWNNLIWTKHNGTESSEWTRKT